MGTAASSMTREDLDHELSLPVDASDCETLEQAQVRSTPDALNQTRNQFPNSLHICLFTFTFLQTVHCSVSVPRLRLLESETY